MSIAIVGYSGGGILSPANVVVAKLNCADVSPASLLDVIFSSYHVPGAKSQNEMFSLPRSTPDISEETVVQKGVCNRRYSMEKCDIEHPPLYQELSFKLRHVELVDIKSFSSGICGAERNLNF